MIICNAPNAIRDISGAVGVIFNPGADVCISKYSSSGIPKLLGGVIYTHYCHNSIQAHIASFDPGFLSRTYLGVVFEYPFVKLGCNKMFAPVPKSNVRSARLASRLGFTLETTIQDVFTDGDLLVFGIRKENRRWFIPPGKKFEDLVYG